MYKHLKEVYILSSVIYCAGRKFILSKDATYVIRDVDATKETPILVLDRMAMSLISGLTGMYIAPFCIASDLRKLEIAARGLKQDDYMTHNPCKVNFIDHVLDFV